MQWWCPSCGVYSKTGILAFRHSGGVPSCGVYSKTGILAFQCSGGVPVVVYTVRLEYQRSGAVVAYQLWCTQQDWNTSVLVQWWCPSGGVPVVVYTVRLEYQRSGAVVVSQWLCTQ